MANLRLAFVARRENTLYGKLVIIKRAGRLIFWLLQLPQAQSLARVWSAVFPYEIWGTSVMSTDGLIGRGALKQGHNFFHVPDYFGVRDTRMIFDWQVVLSRFSSGFF